MTERATGGGIVSRWEWRTFGQRFGGAETVFAALPPTGTHESDERYLLVSDGVTVKLRDDLLDVKVLRARDARGLERWEPIIKANVPLSADDVRLIVSVLGADGLEIDQDAYTLDALIALLASAGPLREVGVHKRRVRYSVAGCMAELTDVTADGRPIRTIAIESEDAAAVIAAVRSIDLGDYVNTSYPTALRAILDDMPPRYAVIDVGTNSVKFHVGERAAGGTWRRVVDRAEITRLGERLEDHGEITPEALARTVTAIAGMADEARRNGALAIAAVGTAGLRAARNRTEVVTAILDGTGVDVEVISGEEESRLAYLAVAADLGAAGADASVVVFDTGGGSSQFTFGHGIDVDERFSLPVGAARFTERFGLDGAVSSAVLDEARAAISAELSRIAGRPLPDALIAMGGAATNIAAVKHGLAVYDPDVIQGTVLDRSEIDRQIELYRTRDAEERRTIVGLQPKRGEVILAGACIVRCVMEMLGVTTMTVSDRGLRHGVLEERFGSGVDALASGSVSEEERHE